MDGLHPILGHIFEVENKAKTHGVNKELCQELLTLVERALTHMSDEDLNGALADLRFNVALSTHTEVAFNKLIKASIINISEYIYPIDF
jgi:hypothetical protein